MLWKHALLVLLSTFISDRNCWAYIVDPGPVVKATQGEVWPKVQSQKVSNKYFIVRPSQLEIKAEKHTCKILEEAIQRYRNLLDAISEYESYGVEDMCKDPNCLGPLKQLQIHIEKNCTDDDKPFMGMAEQYSLIIGVKAGQPATLISFTVWGALRGLETFSQTVYYHEHLANKIVNATEIMDFPRFKHRGLLVDTARHFLPMVLIRRTIDAMAYNKLNILHWHITDDHSFPYVSREFPALSEKGAYHPKLVYTPYDVKTIIEYARIRGVRVMVEFDTPGHTRSWGEGILGILTPCYSKDGVKTGQFGPMDPSKVELYTVLRKFFAEITERFSDELLHLGGDEVEFECWASNPEIKRFMAKLKIVDDYKALENYYIQKLLEIVSQFKVRPVLWEEVFVNGVKLPNNTVIHVWREDGDTVLNNVTKAGFQTIFSACWYLDHLANGGDWQKFYRCDPFDLVKNDVQRDLIIGGEACMWAESVDQTNFDSRVWPRAAAVAEKLWSAYGGQPQEARARLEEHTCRLNKRHIRAQPPNGPGVCLI